MTAVSRGKQEIAGITYIRRCSPPVVSRNATYLANIAFRKTRIKASLIDMLTLRSG